MPPYARAETPCRAVYLHTAVGDNKSQIYATDKYIRHPVYTHSGKRVLDIKKHLDFSGCLFTFLYFFLLGAIVLLNILHMFFCPIRSIFFYAFDSAIMYSVIIQFILVREKD